MFARADTPGPVLSKLRELAANALKTPEMTRNLNTLSLSPYRGSLDAFAEDLKTGEASQAEDNRRLGIVPQ
jgi:tripartite-type tricarboxylate transporter receptor subunit TctC